MMGFEVRSLLQGVFWGLGILYPNHGESHGKENGKLHGNWDYRAYIRVKG